MTRSPAPISAQRGAALDPSRSFIVQAPAGSGKTELLIQRYLVLLSRVSSARGDRRDHLHQEGRGRDEEARARSARAARNDPPPDEPHEALTWEHARAALERDRALGWRLEEKRRAAAHPDHRRAVRLAHAPDAGARRLRRAAAERRGRRPAVPRGGAGHARRCWKTRATNAAAPTRGGSPRAPGQQRRGRRGAHRRHAAQRDHWMRNLGKAGRSRRARSRARRGVARAAVRHAGESARLPAASPRRAPTTRRTRWIRLSPQLPHRGRRMAQASLPRRTCWREQRAHLRRRVARASSDLPPARYTDAQWEVLGAIARLLPLAVAEAEAGVRRARRGRFRRDRAGRARRAAASDAPTDLLLSLDYRIRHILVDEFQDTSFTPVRAAGKAHRGLGSAERRPHAVPGRRPDAVDLPLPRGRGGLFLSARNEGIGRCALEPLTLSANFRSQAGIVDWVNRAFAQVMPQAENVAAGAVPYSPSRRRCTRPESDAVRVHAFFNGDAQPKPGRWRRSSKPRRPKIPEAPWRCWCATAATSRRSCRG